MHIRNYCLIMMLLMAFEIQAQQDSVYMDKTEQSNKIFWHFGGIFESTKVASVQANSIGLLLVVQAKKHILFGIYGNKHVAEDFQRQLIFPNIYQMNYKHGGFIAGYRTHWDRAYELNLESRIGFGEVKWTELESETAFLGDKFSLFQLQASIDYLITDFIAINGFIGYRQMRNLMLSGLSNEDFSGVNLGVALKIGKIR